MIKKYLLFIAIATSTVMLTGCEPSVIQDIDCKVYAACAGNHLWVGEQLYDYVFKVVEDKAKAEHPDEMGDMVFEPGDDWWNLDVLKGQEDVNEETISAYDLKELIVNGQKPSSDDYPYMTAKLVYSKTYSPLLYALYEPDGDETYQDDNGNYVVVSYRYIKDRAIKTVYDECGGNFEPLKEKIAEQVKIFDYRKNEKASSKKVTVYDVVYLVKDKQYVRCTVTDLNGERFEIEHVKDSEYFSDLGF